jgi:hypothetical protein
MDPKISVNALSEANNGKRYFQRKSNQMIVLMTNIIKTLVILKSLITNLHLILNMQNQGHAKS